MGWLNCGWNTGGSSNNVIGNLTVSGTTDTNGLTVESGNTLRVNGASNTDFLEISFDETEDYAIIGTNNQTTQGIWIKTSGSSDEGALVLGDLITDATNKQSRLSSFPYTIAQEKVATTMTFNSSLNNTIAFGGGFSDHQAATTIQFYVASSVNTTSGTRKASIVTAGLNLENSAVLQVMSLQVVTNRQTGWTAPTGTSDRTSFATGSVTLSELAERVKALLEDLGSSSGHGLIDV